jgi:hypothetical protein
MIEGQRRPREHRSGASHLSISEGLSP